MHPINTYRIRNCTSSKISKKTHFLSSLWLSFAGAWPLPVLILLTHRCLCLLRLLQWSAGQEMIPSKSFIPDNLATWLHGSLPMVVANGSLDFMGFFLSTFPVESFSTRKTTGCFWESYGKVEFPSNLHRLLGEEMFKMPFRIFLHY